MCPDNQMFNKNQINHQRKHHLECFRLSNDFYWKKETILIIPSIGCHLGTVHVNSSDAIETEPLKFDQIAQNNRGRTILISPIPLIDKSYIEGTK